MKNSRIDFRLTSDLKNAAIAQAKEEGLTLSSWLTRIITLKTKKHAKKKIK